jgi:hypothetical protein
MYGIGGEEYSFRKVVDEIEFASFKAGNFPIDFGDLDKGFGINGIIYSLLSQWGVVLLSAAAL